MKNYVVGFLTQENFVDFYAIFIAQKFPWSQEFVTTKTQ